MSGKLRIKKFRSSTNPFSFEKFLLLTIAAVAIVSTAFIINNKSYQSFRKSKAAPARPMKYYAVDRVRTNSDFAQLASWGINTAIVSFYTDDSATKWDEVVNAAASANVNIVIWPSAYWGSDPQGCRWDTPFDDASTGGDMLKEVRPILDRIGNKPNVIGIVNGHEAPWVSANYKDSFGATIADMATIKTQIHDYMNNTVHRNTSYAPFKVWNYIDNIGDVTRTTISDYSGPADYARIMDVAAIWEHCAGGAESPCDGTGTTALSKINRDRQLLTAAGAEGQVELVFLQQTFTMNGGYETKFSLSDLEKYSKEFIDTSNLDGFGYYTWDEGWYSGNLKRWTDLHPAVINIYNYFRNVASPTVTTLLTPTSVVFTPTQVPNTPTLTLTPTPRPTNTPTPRPTNTPTPRPTNTPTPRPTNTSAPTPTHALTPTATPVPSKIMTVSSISYDMTQTWYRTKKLNVYMKVNNKQTGEGLYYARVYYKLTNMTTGRSWSNNGLTNLNGVEKYSISNPARGCYKTTITNVTRYSSWAWDQTTPTNEFCY